MSYCKIGYFACVCCLILCGCRPKEEPDPQVEEAVSRIAHLRDSLNVGRPFVSEMYDAKSKIGGWIDAVSNVCLRTELSLELSETLLSVELTNQPYLAISAGGGGHEQRLSAVDSYCDCALAAFWIMNENGCSPEKAMNFFFMAFQKYKEACFSVPLEWKPLPGEDQRTCDARYDTARKSYDSYEVHMAFIRRFVMPKLPDCWPPELQDEFKRRIEPFFDFPSKDEFLRMMQPRYKRGPLSPSKPDAQKQESDNHDGEVEVDI